MNNWEKMERRSKTHFFPTTLNKFTKFSFDEIVKLTDSFSKFTQNCKIKVPLKIDVLPK